MYKNPKPSAGDAWGRGVLFGPRHIKQVTGRLPFEKFDPSSSSLLDVLFLVVLSSPFSDFSSLGHRRLLFISTHSFTAAELIV